jgi:hypothetical protein
VDAVVLVGRAALDHDPDSVRLVRHGGEGERRHRVVAVRSLRIVGVGEQADDLVPVTPGTSNQPLPCSSSCG